MFTYATRTASAILLFTDLAASPARAQTATVEFGADRLSPIGAPAFACVTFLAVESKLIDRPLDLRFDDLQTAAAQTGAARPKPFVYSDGYKTRAKIHRYASFATLPLFVAEGALGQSLYNNPTDAKKNAHLAVATSIGALFAVNAVTGLWNLTEARHDPNGHTLRTVHSVLMLAATAGFTATAAVAPIDGGGNRELHRSLAVTSIGVATVAYLIMVFGNR